MSVLATIEPTTLQVDPGAEASLAVRVRNRGTIVDRFDISVVGPMADWAVVDPPSLRLFPDKEGEARVTFRPPRGPNPSADSYPFGVAVRAAAEPDASTVEEGHVTVTPFVQLTTEIVPQTSRGSRAGTHEVNVHNLGNTVAEVSVKATDPDRLLNFEVTPGRIGLRPDATATIRAKAKPKDTFLMGSPKRVPFTVQVDEPSAGSYPVPGTLEQQPIIPPWWKVIAGLAVAAVAAVAFLPSLLGGGADASPSNDTAIISPSAEVTIAPTPAPLSEPPATAEPTEEIFSPPDKLTAAGDDNGLNDEMGMSFKCPPNDPCREVIKTRVTQVLANLGGNADGALLVEFSTSVSGTLPLVATWDNRYKYTAGGLEFFAKKVAIDLAPRLSGKPAYIYIEDTNRTTHWYTVPDGTAQLLLTEMYNLPAPPPTQDPGSGGGGTIIYRTFYDTALYNGLLLQAIQFAATPPP